MEFFSCSLGSLKSGTGKYDANEILPPGNRAKFEPMGSRGAGAREGERPEMEERKNHLASRVNADISRTFRGGVLPDWVCINWIRSRHSMKGGRSEVKDTRVRREGIIEKNC